METTLQSLDMDGVYSYADYAAWRFKESLELIKGKIFKMSPAPLTMHQRVAGALYFKLYGYLYKKSCEVFVAPFDVRLPKKGFSTDDKEVFTVVQPDLCVVCDPAKIDRRGCVGAPDFIIEILSESTGHYDLNEKFYLYEEAGVPEYWVASPEYKTIMVFWLEDGKYEYQKTYSAGGSITPKTLPGLSVLMDDIFDY